MPPSSSNQLAWRAGRSGFHPLPVLLLTLALIVFAMLLGDALVFRWRPDSFPKEIWVLFDPLVHAVIGLLVISPLLLLRTMPPRRRLAYLVLVVAAAVLIDLDHFVAAGSLSITKAMSLPGGRPETHSLLFPLVCGLLVFGFRHNSMDGWLIFAVLSSHIVRDASTGSTPLLWPFPFDRLSLPVYYALEMGLCLAAWVLARSWSQKPARTFDPRSGERRSPEHRSSERRSPERRSPEAENALRTQPSPVPVLVERDDQ